MADVLPPRTLLRLTPVFEACFQGLTFRAKRKTRERMATALQTTPADPAVRRATRRFVGNAVRRSIDDLVVNRMIENGDLPPGTVLGLDHLERALSAGRGAFVVSGHFYANRVAKRYLAEIGRPMMSVRKDAPPDSVMGRLGKRRMQPRYIDFLRDIVVDEVSPADRDCGLCILKRLRKNGLVNIHFDAAFSRERQRLPFLWDHACSRWVSSTSSG